MKITCNSCGSKYTIADAKVQGKKVKVRCKGCKESILVDGTQIGPEGSGDDDDDDDPAAPATTDTEAGATPSDAPSSDSSDGEAAAASDATSDAPKAKEAAKVPAAGAKKDLWSVNISDDESRDMTLSELVAAWKDGTVNSDAYVWKDGMGDWKPILEVGELKLKLGSPPKKAGGVVSSATAGAAAGKSDDLFGGVGAAGNEPSEPERPAAAGGEEKPTGARNDSSVLFSLDSLTSGPSAPKAASSSGDDIFAGLGSSSGGFAGNTDLLTAPAKDPPPAPAGNRAQAPVAEPSKGKGGLIAAILGAAVILGGVLVFLNMGGEEKAAEPDPKVLAAAAAEKEAAEKAQKELAEKMAKLEAMEAELKKAKEEAIKKGEDPEEAAKKKQEELDKEKAEAEKKAADEKKDSGSTAAPSSASTGSSGSTKTDSAAAKPAASSGGGGPAFDVGAARAALSAAAANAAACAKPGGPTGSGKVQVTFSTSGRVTSATVVSGPFGGTAVGGCVASTFRRARVPAFSGDSKTVAKSFSVN